jgi:hypothetical protein
MRKYKRVTIERVELRGMTAWRVVGWITKGKRVSIAYFPTEKGAKQMKKAVAGTAPRTHSLNPRNE